MAIQPKATTLGVIVGNRGFSPDPLAASGHADTLDAPAEDRMQELYDHDGEKQ